MIDTGPVLRMAADLADEIVRQAEDTGRDGFVRQIAVCVELDLGSSITFFTASADDRPWVQVAFLDKCANEIERRHEMRRAATDD